MRAVGLALLFAAVAGTLVQAQAPPLDTITLPPGFSISLYTPQPVPNARQLTLSTATNPEYPNAVIVYAGSRAGSVHALIDLEGTGETVTVVEVLAGQDAPNGVDFHDGSLYVAETRRITRYDNPDAAALAGQPLAPGTVISEAWNPEQDSHSSHYIRVGPDELLYVPQGSPENTGPCERYQNITQCAVNRMNLEGQEIETYVYGIRNSVGYDWDDEGNLWVTTNARDNLNRPDHNDTPDDLLMYVPADTPADTLNFGFPYCHWRGAGNALQRGVGPGTIQLDDTFFPAGVANAEDPNYLAFCEDEVNNVPPTQALGPHVAALGARFYRGDAFPAEYNRTLFIAQRGSWNREPAIGYRVMNAQVDPETGETLGFSIFAAGWLNDATQQEWGRPVDVLPLPDGSLLVSDDTANTVYRIAYGPEAAATTAG